MFYAMAGGYPAPYPTGPLPYSVSIGLAITAFDKLQGIKIYCTWKMNTRTILMTLRQWGVVAGTVPAPIPAYPNAPTAAETRAIYVYEV